MTVNYSCKVCVIGLGYIGLPTASLLATKGYKVLGVDTNTEVVDTINSGLVHIVESGLDNLVKAAVQSGNLKAAMVPELADIYIVAVPTPFKYDFQPNLCYVEAAVNSIAPLLKEGDLVILESTSPIGTTQFIKDTVDQVSKVNCFYAHCPERVIPGKVLEELIENDRIIGGLDKDSAEVAADFYQTFVKGKIIQTDAKTAELCKLTENSFRDVNIAFANELSLICDKEGIDVWELIQLANHHPRVNILNPAPGVGGHCIAVDPWFIVSSAPAQAKLIRCAREVNDYKPKWVVDKVIDSAKCFDDPTIVCFGLAFKPNIDDMRGSPALNITKKLISLKIGKIYAVEPNLPEVEGINLINIETAIKKADILLILVKHNAFLPSLFEGLQKEKIVIDTVGLLV